MTLFLIILGVSIRHDFIYLWLASMFFLFFFMYYALLNHESTWVEKLTKIQQIKVDRNNEILKNTRESFNLKDKLKKYFEDRHVLNILANVYAIFFTINGHTLLLFLLFPLGLNTTIFILVYLSFLSINGVYTNIKKLTNISKIWKNMHFTYLNFTDARRIIYFFWVTTKNANSYIMVIYFQLVMEWIHWQCNGKSSLNWA